MPRPLIAMLLSVGLWSAGAELLAADQAPATRSLAAAYAGRLKIGAAIEPDQLARPDGVLLAQQFSSLVAENTMKPMRIHPQEDHYDFGPADAIVAFAEQHGLAVRGHTLLWGSHTPDWFWQGAKGQPATREQVLQRLKQHIATVVGHYRGRVYAWDVVNEAIDPDQPSCLRDDRWLQVVGPDYMAVAFRAAHAADPQARLFINDFNTQEPAKRDCLARVVKALLAEGVPVQGIGHQTHISIYWPSLAAIDQSLGTFARLGLENQLTELDMSLYQHHDYQPQQPLAQRLNLQAERYRDLMALVLAHPEVTAVTWWGVADDHSWLNHEPGAPGDDQPLLFDRQQRPKPAFWAVLHQAPHQ
ncbi:endo-1,4-beta-xylanase [Pseudomonas sp. SORGH_AS 211]|uniref:endo-1,4-beta-xylanase n=1 Tax=Pseudomonas sp. SORGH_AS_0211 TaxID=3041796 RepID=UPI0028564FC9|nr:endo-1,4-beta-xylanase [Pseudomonas sp. SORGH_AS_0211]MDR6178534.1 endo-1,4-beta-xylanase [Pseudomonas sp. SORGH_AS_0211]